MPIWMAILWGILIPTLMLAVHKYWVPKLLIDAEKSANHRTVHQEAHTPGHALPRVQFLRVTAIWIVCGLFASICGYKAAEYAISGWSFYRLWLVFTVFACIAVTDAERMLIPNKCSLILLTGGCVWLIGLWISTGEFPLWTLTACLISMVVMLLGTLIMAAITRGGLGMGDVKIISTFSFVCGIHAGCYVLTMALILCALCSALLLAAKKRGLKDLLPLGPFLWVALGISMIFKLI